MGTEGLAANVDAVSTVINGGPGCVRGTDPQGKAAVRGVLCLNGLLLLQHFILQACFLHGVAEEAGLTLAGEANILFGGAAEGKGGGEVPGAVLVEGTPAFLIHRVALGVGDVGIDSLAIGGDNTTDEGGGAHAAFNLEGEYPCLNQLWYGAVHAHILQGKLVRSLAFLVQNLAGFFVDKLIGPAAGFQAASTVAALAKEHPGMDALAAFGNAHIPMHEVFHLNASALAEKAELGKSHFPAYHDAGDAVFLEPFDGVFVVGVHHD